MMRTATREDKGLILEILTAAFLENASINYLIPDDGDRSKRIRNLIDYSFELCLLFGRAFLANDGTGCALVLFPERKRTTIRTIFLDLKLVVGSIGAGNVLKALRRETLVARHHPEHLFYHLWFVGVHPKYQKKGIGTALLSEIMMDAEQMRRPVYLETSTLSNITWYGRFGLKVFGHIELGYTLFLLSNGI